MWAFSKTLNFSVWLTYLKYLFIKLLLKITALLYLVLKTLGIIEMNVFLYSKSRHLILLGQCVWYYWSQTNGHALLEHFSPTYNKCMYTGDEIEILTMLKKSDKPNFLVLFEIEYFERFMVISFFLIKHLLSHNNWVKFIWLFFYLMSYHSILETVSVILFAEYVKLGMLPFENRHFALKDEIYYFIILKTNLIRTLQLGKIVVLRQ